jgi:hypothetical protein
MHTLEERKEHPRDLLTYEVHRILRPLPPQIDASILLTASKIHHQFLNPINITIFSLQHTQTTRVKAPTDQLL